MNLLMESWNYQADQSASVPVLPDGCFDIIAFQDAGGKRTGQIARPSDSPVWVQVEVGSSFQGIRLCPGIRPREREVARFLDAHAYDITAVRAELADLVFVDAAVLEALSLLGTRPDGIQKITRELGVSERTLRRHLVERTGWPPKYWLGLARARRAARKVVEGLPLSEVALEENYSDQPHMTNDLRRWFGATPTRLKAEVAAGVLRLESGYC